VSEWRREKIQSFVTARDLVSGFDWRSMREWMGIDDEDSNKPKSKKKRNWKLLIRQLCEGYTGIQPQHIGDLTLFQLKMLSDDERSVRSGGFRLTRAQWSQMSKEQRRAYMKKAGALDGQDAK
jgi:hypothetical protein